VPYVADLESTRPTFESIDRAGVGALMRTASDKGRSVNRVKIGICGEHGGDPSRSLLS